MKNAMRRARAKIIQRRIIKFILAGALALVPIFIQDNYILHILILVYLYSALSMAWDLVMGYTGILHLGFAGFFGIGGYTSALLAMRLGISPWLGLFIGGAFAACISVGVALPCLKLKENAYIMMVTLGFAAIVQMIISNLVDITRGELGLWGIPPFSAIDIPHICTITFTAANRSYSYYLLMVFTLGLAFLLGRLTKSRIGLMFESTRQSIDVAQVVGINTSLTKILATFIGCFIAGMVGSFYGHYIGILVPSILSFSVSLEILTIVVVGGMHTIYGSVVGAFVVVILKEALRPLGPLRLVIYGCLLIVIITLSPGGILGKIRDVTRRYGWRVV